MAEQQKQRPWIDEELAHELSETVSTLTRLGVTLVGLPIAFLPYRQRQQVKQLASEALRIGATLPRAVGTMLEESAEEWKEGEPPREDLGSRLRREQRRLDKVERRTARSALGPEEEAELPNEEEATEEVEEDIQEAWETGPESMDGEER